MEVEYVKSTERRSSVPGPEGLIEERKDIMLNEMVERLVAEQSVRISRSALSAWLRRYGWTFKKVRARTGAGPPRHPEASPRLVRRPTRSRSGS